MNATIKPETATVTVVMTLGPNNVPITVEVTPENYLVWEEIQAKNSDPSERDLEAILKSYGLWHTDRFDKDAQEPKVMAGVWRKEIQAQYNVSNYELNMLIAMQRISEKYNPELSKAVINKTLTLREAYCHSFFVAADPNHRLDTRPGVYVDYDDDDGLKIGHSEYIFYRALCVSRGMKDPTVKRRFFRTETLADAIALETELLAASYEYRTRERTEFRKAFKWTAEYDAIVAKYCRPTDITIVL